jgi:putative ABC transport system permease protein
VTRSPGRLLSVKLRRDVAASWPRFAMMVLAVAVCLSAFGSVLFAWSVSDRESTAAYMSTEPASATTLLDQGVAEEEMAAIVEEAGDTPGVLEATGRTQFTGDIEVGGTLSEIPLQTFVASPDDSMRMARVFGEPAWPASPSEILIGSDSLELLNVAVGDTVTVKTPAGDSIPLRVAGTVTDPSLSPSPQEQTARGYLSSAALSGPDGEAVMDQLKLQIADPDTAVPSADRERVVSVAEEVGAWLHDERGLTIREIQVPQPYEHPHQWQADALLLSLLAGAAAALLLATMLVANMLNNLFIQQTSQVGIMKAIGARPGRIGRHYLTMTLLIAAAATGIALPAADLLGRVAAESFLGFLGITATNPTPPGWTYLVVLAAGLGVPVLMALPPVIRASRLTVRAAIDHHGTAAVTGTVSGLVARLSRIRRINRALLMALRNTLRRPARSALSVGLLACAGMVFITGMSLSSGVEAVEEIGNERRNWDVDARLAEPTAMDQVDDAIAQVSEVADVEGFMVGETGVAGEGGLPVTRTWPDQGHGRVAVTAVPDDSHLFTPPDLLEGRWLRPAETGAVVLNQSVRADTLPDVEPGDSVQLILDGRATTWRVAGIVQERHGGGGAYTTAAGYAEATGQETSVTTLRITTAAQDEDTRRAAAEAVSAALAEQGIDVASADSVSRQEAISRGHLGPVVLILLGIALPLGVVGLIGLASTMSANVLDRTREFGVMHAIGALPAAVRRMVTTEGLILAFMSCLVAIPPALALTALLGEGLGAVFFNAPLPYRVSLPAIGLWSVLVVLGSALATEAAASRASRLTVREALAYL